MKNKKRRSYKLLFIAPSLIGVFIFYLFPLAETFWQSISNGGGDFVGLENFSRVLSNEAFKQAAGNTARFISICIPLLLFLSLILAMAVSFLKKDGQIFKTSFLIPMAIPATSIVFLWQLLFHKQGIVNGVMASMGLSTLDFMNTSAAFWVLIFTYLWKNCGYHMILWLSGLEAISGSLYEAASMDGAGAFAQFRYITLPALMPTLSLSAILALINSFKVFREAYLVAGSYPHESIYMLQHLFNNWFLSLDISRLAAAAVMLAIVLCTLILFLNIIWKRRDS